MSYRRVSPWIGFSLASLGAIGAWSALGQAPIAVLAWYVAMSAIAYLVYGFDKARSKSKGWRVPEQTLHLLALAGGWPGALAAQHLMQHKVRKAPFIVTFWIAVLLNIAVLVALFTPLGEQLLK